MLFLCSLGVEIYYMTIQLSQPMYIGIWTHCSWINRKSNIAKTHKLCWNMSSIFACIPTLADRMSIWIHIYMFPHLQKQIDGVLLPQTLNFSVCLSNSNSKTSPHVPHPGCYLVCNFYSQSWELLFYQKVGVDRSEWDDQVYGGRKGGGDDVEAEKKMKKNERRSCPPASLFWQSSGKRTPPGFLASAQ